MGKKKSGFLEYERVAAAAAKLIAQGYTEMEISIPKIRKEIGPGGSNSTVNKYINRFLGIKPGRSRRMSQAAKVASPPACDTASNVSLSELSAAVEREQLVAVDLIGTSMTRLLALQRELRTIRQDMERSMDAIERSIAYSKMMTPRPAKEMRVLLLRSSELQRASVAELTKSMLTVEEWIAQRGANPGKCKRSKV